MSVIVKRFMDNPPRAEILVGAVPGAGHVGKIAVDHLIHELKADLVAEIYTSAFPPQIYIQDDGIAVMPRFQLYHARANSGMLIFTGPAQTESGEAGYQVVDRLLELAKESGVRIVYSLAAYILGREPLERGVHGTATSQRLLEKLGEVGVKLMDGGTITGMNGLLFAMASLKGMEGACLLGETAGYYTDALASKEVLRVFARLSGVEVSYGMLDVMAAETEKALKAMRAELAKREETKESKPGRMDYIS